MQNSILCVYFWPLNQFQWLIHHAYMREGEFFRPNLLLARFYIRDRPLMRSHGLPLHPPGHASSVLLMVTIYTRTDSINSCKTLLKQEWPLKVPRNSKNPKPHLFARSVWPKYSRSRWKLTPSTQSHRPCFIFGPVWWATGGPGVDR